MWNKAVTPESWTLDPAFACRSRKKSQNHSDGIVGVTTEIEAVKWVNLSLSTPWSHVWGEVVQRHSFWASASGGGKSTSRSGCFAPGMNHGTHSVESSLCSREIWPFKGREKCLAIKGNQTLDPPVHSLVSILTTLNLFLIQSQAASKQPSGSLSA
jgi:hypothetical protein